MLTVETLQPTNHVISQILHTLADEGFVTIINEDEEMSETTLHFALINYFYNALKLFLSEREDSFVAANLRISYDQTNPLKWFAPDVFVAFGAPRRERTSYHLPTEKIMPQVVFEVASEQTAGRDLGDKYADYARLGVEEYYLLDPERKYLPQPLLAYQRSEENLLVPVSLKDKRCFSPRLNLEIVDTGDNFRLFDSSENEFLMTPEETAAELVKLKSLLKQN